MRADTARSVPRPTSTYKRRRRSLSPKRQAELERWIERWGIAHSGPPLDWTETFGRDGDVCLDIGFGHGESTIELARNQPDLDVLAVEVHDPGVVTLLDAIEHVPLPQVRVVHGDALLLLDRIRPESLALVRIFFPDPWPKARQQHRRLLRRDLVGALTDRLRIGGELHLATDIDDYAVQILDACDDERRLAGGTVERPAWRPSTRFEQRAVEAGRTATDLRYRRTT